MTTQTVKINDPALTVKDKLGWGYSNPFIAIWDVDEIVSTKSRSIDGISDYVETSRSHVIKYEGNYWGSKQMQSDGLDSRPLAHFIEFDAESVYEVNLEGEYSLDDSGEKIPTGEIIPAYKIWTDKFTVDMEHPDSIHVRNGPMTGKEERNELISLDVKRKFA
jgi:hypothetical protein